MNIIKKIRIPLSYQILYLSFFLVVKCFVAKFITYYQTEKKYSTEDIKLNCLIVEALRNYNYIQFELLPILRYLFKNKEKDYQIYYQDLLSFINTVRSIFIDEYVSNAAENLLSTYINITTKVENTKYNFYEKYNTLLISNNKKNSGIFQDSRSVLIEMITLIANCIRDFDIINSENTAITNKEEENFKVIKQLIELFYDKVLKYAKENQKCLLCLYDEEEKQFTADFDSKIKEKRHLEKDYREKETEFKGIFQTDIGGDYYSLVYRRDLWDDFWHCSDDHLPGGCVHI